MARTGVGRFDPPHSSDSRVSLAREVSSPEVRIVSLSDQLLVLGIACIRFDVLFVVLARGAW